MIKYMIIDVDGTMTDGGIFYDNQGNEFKKFNTRDAAAFFALKQSKIQVYVITGRVSDATARRMAELGVENLYQNIKDKYSFIKIFMDENGISKDDLGYIGDDLNDWHSMTLAGWIGCPKNSCAEVKSIANYISSFDGGEGAVRDIVEYYLREKKMWENAIKNVYKIGR